MMNLNHIGIVTNQPKEMLGFYEGIIGLKKECQFMVPKSITEAIFEKNADYYIAKLCSDSLCIELFWPERKKTDALSFSGGMHHFCIQTENRDAFCDDLKERSGIKIMKVFREDGSYVLFVKDPDGNLIEVK